MTKKLLKSKFILELKEEGASSTDNSRMEEEQETRATVLEDTEDEEEEEEEEEEEDEGQSSVNSSSPPSSTHRLIHSGSHPTNVNGDINEHNSKFLLFRKMTADAAAAIAAAAAAAAPPIVPLPLRQSDFLHPASSQTSAFKRLSDEHWKATLSSLYGGGSSSHYYSAFPPPSPFLAGKLFSPFSANSSPFQPPPPPPPHPHLRSFIHPELSLGRSSLWPFDPLRRKRSPSPSSTPAGPFVPPLLQPRESSDPIHPPKRSTCFPPSHSERGLLPSPPLRMGGPGSSGLPTPPAMKRYKRERLILPSSCTLSKDQIIHMPIDQFNDYLARSNFSEEELSRLKDARRKGKNRVAARRSRDHRLQEVRCLKSRQERVKKDKHHVFKEYETSIEDCKLWERIHELFTYHISRFVEGQKGSIVPGAHEGPSTSSMGPTRAFNPPPLVLNSC